MLMRLGHGLGIGCPALSGGEGGSYLDTVLTSVCCDLDATVAGSYNGSGQLWKNLTASPADGASQSDYDFHLGADATASTDDPTFTGAAGDMAAYWSFDGGDFFELAGSNTSFLESLHKTTGGTDFWMAVAFQNGASTSYNIFTQADTPFTDAGFKFGANGAERINLQQEAGGAGTFKNSTGSFTDGADTLLIVSYDESVDQVSFWINSATAETVSYIFDTGTAAATSVARIGAAGDGGGKFPNNTRLYHFSMGNEFLDNTKAAALITHLEARHGRDYTP